MKKKMALILIVVFCLAFSACGKSEAAEALEDKINGLTEIDGAQIQEIREAYQALTEKEQKQVKIYQKFLEYSNTYYEELLVGTWYPFALDLYRPETAFDPRYGIVLNEDMTFVQRNDGDSNDYGQWEVEDGELILHGTNEIHAETFGTVNPAKDYFSFTIEWGDGKVGFNTYGTPYYQEAEYDAALADVLLAVDTSKEDINGYIGFTSRYVPCKDEWGALTGESRNVVTLQNLAYDEGWMYLASSDDFLLEVLYPDHHQTYHRSTGKTSTYQVHEGSYTLSRCCVFETIGLICLDEINMDSTMESDLSLDDMSLGRARGTIYFINRKYITDVCPDENGSRMLMIDYESLTSQPYVVQSVFWEDDNWEY